LSTLYLCTHFSALLDQLCLSLVFPDCHLKFFTFFAVHLYITTLQKCLFPQLLPFFEIPILKDKINKVLCLFCGLKT